LPPQASLRIIRDMGASLEGDTVSSRREEVTKQDPLAAAEAILSKVLPFASAADALARRIVGKVRALALLGFMAALWITIACTDTFKWDLGAALITFLLIALPAAILWKLHGMLRKAIGLPQRLTDRARQLSGKVIELKQAHGSRSRVASVDAPASGFRQIWRTSRSVLEVKSLGDEAQVVVSDVAGSVVLANPIFAIVLAGTAGITLVLVGVAGVIGLAYLL
jgi:hypothetical protein